MSVTSDSIQTLLKQRRDLRECLHELRKEVANMHENTDQIIDKALGKNSPKLPIPKQDASPPGGEILADPVAALKLIQQVTQKQIAPPDPKPEIPAFEKKVKVTNEPDSSKVAKGSIQFEPKLASVSENTEDFSLEPKILQPNNPVNVISEAKEEEPEIENLLNHAILLAGFFLHHPSSAGNEQLNALDAAIAKAQTLSVSNKTETTMTPLKNAYRNVVSATYSTEKVNGKTISDSCASVGMFWVIPMVVSALVLVLLPGLLLLRSLAQRMFVEDFASEIMLSIGSAASFVWGIMGVLACVALSIAREVKARRYEKERSPGIAIRAAIGGVLGLGVFLGFSFVDQITGLQKDIAVSLISFLVGASSSFIRSRYQQPVKIK